MGGGIRCLMVVDYAKGTVLKLKLGGQYFMNKFGIKALSLFTGLLLALLVPIISVSFASVQTMKIEDNDQIKKVIENYYAESYSIWMNLEMEDLSKYLDLESVQCYNKTVALEKNIEKWKYTIEKGYFEGKRERHKIDFKYNAIEITGNDAVVKVILSGETSGMPAYSFFVSFGENTFKLKKMVIAGLFMNMTIPINSFMKSQKLRN